MNVRPVSMQATPIKRSNPLQTNTNQSNFGNGRNLMKSWYKGMGITAIVSCIAGTITGICTTAQKQLSAIKPQATNVVQKAGTITHTAKPKYFIQAALPKKANPPKKANLPKIGKPVKPQTQFDPVKKAILSEKN